MSTMFKYRVHEVAKDFKLPTKKITEILTKYAQTPKNHMQVLTIDELDIVFEYLTSTNQIESIEEIYAVQLPAPEPESKKAADETPAEVAKPPAASESPP
ncbi:MAG: translation initiation factor IF-2 N-terminal domain-containing protein, partial [Oscillospiraceae bacterium]|nr:translation initiation factor IF-2 N-terminal domain-containing protein [Oscillospiraceae bacterium]